MSGSKPDPSSVTDRLTLSAAKLSSTSTFLASACFPMLISDSWHTLRRAVCVEPGSCLLTPNRLKAQIQQARAEDVELPKIVPVHMSLEHEKAILKELSVVERELGIDLEPGFEGMVAG